MTPTLLNADGTYNRSAIMRKALMLVAFHAKRNPHLSRSILLSCWLKDVWAEAHRAAARFQARHGGNAVFGIIFDAISTSFRPGAPCPAGAAVTPARSPALVR